MSSVEIDRDDFEKDLASLASVSEVFFKLDDLMARTIGSDGETLLIQNGSDSYYMVNETGWRELQGVHERFLKEMFDLDKPLLISDPDQIYENIDEFVDTGVENIDTLLAFPVHDDGAKGVLLIWKKKINEKHQVMVPLIVGSEMIGVTTQVKNKKIENSFDENIISTLEELSPLVGKMAEMSKSFIDENKEKVAKQIDNLDTEESITEVAKMLTGQLLGVSTSIENMKSVMRLIKKESRNNIKLNENVNILESFISSMDENILKATLRASENEIMRNVLGNKLNVYTQTFFENLIYPYIIRACHSERDAVCYIDTKIPKEILLDPKSSYSFINTLIHYLFEWNAFGKKIYFNIRKSLQNTGLFLEIITQEFNEQLSEDKIQSLITGNDAPKALALLYEEFVRSGGTLQVRADGQKSMVTYSLYLPSSVASELMIADIQIPEKTKVGFLIDSKKDYLYANNMARYLFSLGLSKGKFVASEKESIVKDKDLTHLVVFESRFDRDFFRERLKSTNLIVMIVLDGCPQNDKAVLLDYSNVDMEMHKYDKHLKKMEEFLILGGLR